jgi:hypothetical protein
LFRGYNKKSKTKASAMRYIPKNVSPRRSSVFIRNAMASHPTMAEVAKPMTSGVRGIAV